MDKNIFKSKISIEEAKKIIIENTKPLESIEVDLKKCLSKVLREDILALYPFPHFNSSAMDGYALNYENYEIGKLYKVNETILAGKVFKGKIKKDEVLRIMTGGKVPDGLNLVIPVENSNEKNGYVSFRGDFKEWDNIRREGEEYKKGEIILNYGKILNAEDLGLIASQGIKKVKVSKVPETIIFISGNEFAKKNSSLKDGKIFDANSIMLSSLCKYFNVKVKKIFYLKDDLEIIKKNFEKLKAEDFYIISGGISKGITDFSLKGFEEVGGKILFSKVLQKPGGPISFGKKDEKLFLFLPGNPVSSYISFLYYGSILIQKLKDCKENFLIRIPTFLNENMEFRIERTEFIRVKVLEENGKLICFPLKKQGSHMITSLTGADGIWEKPSHKLKFEKGDLIYVYLIKRGFYGI